MPREENLFEGIAQKATAMMQRCQSGSDPDACMQMRGSPLLNMLQGGKPTQGTIIKEAKRLSLLPKAWGGPMNYTGGPEGYAEGGEAFMTDPSEMESMIEEEMDDDFSAIAEILGPEGWSQVEEAMAQYPAVAEVVEMAIQTNDGYVEGEGGPKEDMVPARLSDGEYVISAEAVQVLGLENLEKIHEEAKRVAASK